MFRLWRRIDQAGLELARIEAESRGVTVSSNLVDGGASPFAIRYIWSLDRNWRTRVLRIEHMNGDDRWLTIERMGVDSWRVDNQHASHLDGCAEIDLSATPFCNTLAIRLLGRDGAFSAAYVSATDLSVKPSKQRYERLAEDRWRYTDLGIESGFSADIEMDGEGFVRTYEGLFEALQ